MRQADGSSRHRDIEQMALPLKLHVSRQHAINPLDFDLLARNRGAALRFLLREHMRHQPLVERLERLVDGAHIVVAHIGHSAAKRIGQAGS